MSRWHAGASQEVTVIPPFASSGICSEHRSSSRVAKRIPQCGVTNKRISGQGVVVVSSCHHPYVLLAARAKKACACARRSPVFPICAVVGPHQKFEGSALASPVFCEHVGVDQLRNVSSFFSE